MKVRIRPEFYELIKNGTKKTEYRKIKTIKSYAFSINLITFVNTETKESITADIESIEIKKVNKIEIKNMSANEIKFLTDYYKNEELGVIINLGKIY